MDLEGYVARFRGITKERVLRSVGFRTMRFLGRFDTVRELSSLGPRAAATGARAGGAFPGVSVQRCVSDLRENGYALGLSLAPDTLAEIRDWAERTPCFGNDNRAWGFLPVDRARAEAAAGERFTVGQYYNTDECPALARLHTDPLFQQIAQRFVGPRARYIATHMWWSFAREDFDRAAQHYFAQMFHYDLDDYRFLKVFFYLSDVDEAAGPHVYVRGSNRGRPLEQRFPLRRYSDEEVEEWYGAERIDEILAPAGAGFVVDTFGIHKGAAPTKRDRLLLQFEFAQRGYGFETDIVPAESLRRLV